MNWFRTPMKAVAGTAGVLFVLLLAAPRAAHAVAAALVQVANTTASPAVTQDVSKMASQLVELTAPIDAFPNGGIPVELSRIDPATGQIGASSFVVPPGQNFVITGVDDLQFFDFVSIVLYDNFTSTANYREIWGLTGNSSNAITASLRFPGIVVVSGHRLSMFITSPAAGNLNYLRLYGYLTAN
jgi:hypothetical protein